MTRRLATLTSRLVLTTVAIVLLVSVLIGTATSLAMRSYLIHQLDEDVRTTVPQLIGGGRGPGPGLGAPFGTLAAQFPDGGTPSGALLEDGPDHRADTLDLDEAALEDLGGVPADDAPHTVHVSGLGDYRVLTVEARDGKIAVGLPLRDVDDALGTLVGWEVVLAALALVLGGGTALLVVRRQLRPLREVADTAHRVAELPLSRGEVVLAERVPERLTDERSEVGRVGQALNSLLSHVELSLGARHRSDLQVRQFLADAAHELRTPLATIAGYAQLAHRQPAEAGTALAKVEAESKRMTALVEDLLLLARLDAGRPLDHGTVDLTRLALDGVSDARVLAPGHHWRLDLPGEAVEVPGDEARLHQVLSNLLTNARLHTPQGTTVTVRVTDAEDRRGWEVHDDGPGFPPDVADRAFQRFVRADAARSRAGGTGLGLALVQAIVTAHGGEVTLSSHPGDTTIAVTFPAGAADLSSPTHG
jgi:two-component system OmpR family sensor kinase